MHARRFLTGHSERVEFGSAGRQIGRAGKQGLLETVAIRRRLRRDRRPRLNCVHRLEQFFVERECRLFVRHHLIEDGVDRFIDGRQADRPGRRPAGAIDQLQMHGRLLPRPIFLVLGGRPNLQPVGLPHVEHPRFLEQ